MKTIYVIEIEHELEGTKHDFKLSVERAAVEVAANIVSFEEPEMVTEEEIEAMGDGETAPTSPELPTPGMDAAAPDGLDVPTTTPDQI